MALRRGKCLLSDLRKKRNWTQQDVADRLREKFEINIKVQTISKYETGDRDIPELTRKALAIIFDCHMDDFYEYFW